MQNHVKKIHRRIRFMWSLQVSKNAPWKMQNHVKNIHRRIRFMWSPQESHERNACEESANGFKNHMREMHVRPRGGTKPCEERAQCTEQIKSSRTPCPEAKRRYRRCMHRRSIRVLTPKPKVHAPQNDLSQWVLGIPLCHSSEVDDRSLGGFVPPEVRKDQLSQIVNFCPKNICLNFSLIY